MLNYFRCEVWQTFLRKVRERGNNVYKKVYAYIITMIRNPVSLAWEYLAYSAVYHPVGNYLRTRMSLPKKVFMWGDGLYDKNAQGIILFIGDSGTGKTSTATAVLSKYPERFFFALNDSFWIYLPELNGSRKRPFAQARPVKRVINPYYGDYEPIENYIGKLDHMCWPLETAKILMEQGFTIEAMDMTGLSIEERVEKVIRQLEQPVPSN